VKAIRFVGACLLVTLNWMHQAARNFGDTLEKLADLYDDGF
jgi:hypothetical protein